MYMVLLGLVMLQLSSKVSPRSFRTAVIGYVECLYISRAVLEEGSNHNQF